MIRCNMVEVDKEDTCNSYLVQWDDGDPRDEEARARFEALATPENGVKTVIYSKHDVVGHDDDPAMSWGDLIDQLELEEEADYVDRKAKEVVDAATGKGVVLLYPDVVISDDMTRVEVYDNVYDLPAAGTFRSVRELGAYDLIEISGVDIDEEYDDAVADTISEACGVFSVPPSVEIDCETTNAYCFWGDDNPYPGKPLPTKESKDGSADSGLPERPAAGQPAGPAAEGP